MKMLRNYYRRNLLAWAGLSALISASVVTAASLNKPQRYVQINLVSDQPGVAALQDTNLVNAWGVSFSAASPFWVSDNGTGKATLYAVTNDTSGSLTVSKLSLEVRIPGEGNPTGQLFNSTTNFHGDVFIFASEDGTISGWRPALGSNAEVLTARSNAVYKGITLAPGSNGPILLAANFREGTVDVYDTNVSRVAQLVDFNAPDGYAPFNVQTIDNTLVFITYAKQDADKKDDVAGPGNGFIDAYDPRTGTLARFATGTGAGGNLHAINSPWGIALAPEGFGRHSGQLLVGNFGSGTIMAFDAQGRFQGLLRAGQGGPVVIDGLWALTFGNGTRAGTPDTLFFTAGPDDESHGLFGALEPFAPGPRHGQ